MVLALRIRLDFDDGGRAHDLLISLRDEDGKEYLRAEAKAEVPKIAPGAVQHVNQILNFAAPAFGRPRRYAFHIHWDGEERARVECASIRNTLTSTWYSSRRRRHMWRLPCMLFESSTH